ncbi:IS4 family transposase [Thauera aromatica]|uniref:IS4 family transposase n=1 Tax=Thauera aromatica TaxID=59405 RepID=UPI003CD0C49E
MLNGKKPPAAPPRLNDVIPLIARLSEFLDRKGDSEPGVKTLWLGLRRVTDFAAGLRHARNLGAL